MVVPWVVGVGVVAVMVAAMMVVEAMVVVMMEVAALEVALWGVAARAPPLISSVMLVAGNTSTLARSLRATSPA